MNTYRHLDRKANDSQVSSWIQCSQELVIVLSLDFTIKEFNPVAEKIYGRDKESVLGQNFFVLCEGKGLKPPFTPDEVSQSREESVKVETQCSKLHCTLSWTITLAVDDNQNPEAFILIAQDITRLRELEAALKKSEELTYGTNQELIKFTELVTGQELREKSPTDYVKNIYSYLEGIIAAVPGYVYWMNRQGVYLGCNDNMAKLYNLKSRKDIVGKTYEDLYNKKTGDGYRKADIQVMSTGEPLTVAETLYSQDGTICVYLSSKVALRDKFGNVIGMLGNSIDITEQKQNEQALKEAKERAESANLAKSEFLAMISHEFRIPLTGILGMAKLINMQDLSPEMQHEYVQNISSAGMYLLNLINDTLDFAKLEAGKFELALASMDLNALIEETCTMLTPLSKAKDLDLIIQFNQSTPYQIIGDKRVLRQIIINLVGNAIKFTEKGHVSIQVECLEKSTHSAKLVISISDTGIGIPEDKQGMIFDHFSQVDSSHSRRYGGTGLGLTITKQLIDLMSGTIGVTSLEGKGTTFRCVIDFPLPKEDPFNFSPWMAYQSTVQILIVDDTPRGEVMRKHLGFSNSQVVSGAEAFNALLASYQLNDPYKIVIVDQKLAKVDPLKLAQSIVKHQELRQSMLVLLPNDGSIKTKEAASASGFFECIVKPIQPLALQIALTAAWEKWTEQLQLKFQAHVSQSTLPSEKADLNTHKVNKIKILLVEDDAIVAIIHKVYLEKLGGTVEIACDGKEALEKLKEPFDLVFMDMGLPDISGTDVVKEFRRRSVDQKYIPIVSLTGYGTEANKREFVEAGVNEVIVKPVFQEQLEIIIQKYCNASLEMKETVS